MKKRMCLLVAAVLLLSCACALAEECKYAGEGSPCEPGWWVDKDQKQHARACFYHVEDKEDMYSHVLITPWADCTLDANEKCTVCGVSYGSPSTGEDDEEEKNERYLLEMFIINSMENGTAPVEATVSGSKMELGFSRNFRNTMMELGYLTSESLAASSDFSLTLPEGNTYPFTGEAVTPKVKMEMSEYGSGTWLRNMEFISIGSPVYENNTAPGTATVSVTVSVIRGKEYTLKKNFTIEGAASQPGDLNQSGSVDSQDATALMKALAGWGNAIDNALADMNGDGAVTVADALALLRKIAGK